MSIKSTSTTVLPLTVPLKDARLFELYIIAEGEHAGNTVLRVDADVTIDLTTAEDGASWHRSRACTLAVYPAPKGHKVTLTQE